MNTIGSYLNRQKVTGRLYFQRTGQPYVDLGNVLLVKQDPKIDRAQQLSYSGGRVQITHEEPGKIDRRWSFKLDEQMGPQLRLLNLATEVDKSQVAGNYTFLLTDDAGNPTISQGEPAFVGYYGISNIQFSLNIGTPDHVFAKIDYNAGMVTLANDGYLIGLEADITMSFDAPDIVMKQYTLLSEAFVRGTAMIVLEDQNAGAARAVITFPASINTGDWGENDGMKNQEYTLNLVELGAATILQRE